MPSYPALDYKLLEINYLTFTLSERQDCKFIISNIYSDSVENVSANFRYERSSRIGWVEIEGNIKLDEPYYIKGGFQLFDLIITELKSHMTC